MHFQYLPYVWIPFTSAAITAVLSVYAWRHRRVPGAAAFAVLMLVVTVWSLSNGLEMAGDDLPTKLFWATLEYACYAVVAPTLWFALTLQYIGRGTWLTRRRLIALCTLPALTIALILTNDSHGLVRRGAVIDATGLFPTLVKTSGPWFYFQCIASYLLLFAAIVLLLRTLRRLAAPYRGQILVLLIGLLIPMVSIAVYNSGHSPIPHYDVSPILMSVSALIVAWGLFHYRLFDLAPVARATVIDGMDDGVIVLDTRRRIVDINPAARAILGQQGATRSDDVALGADNFGAAVIGAEATHAFCAWDDLLRLTQNPAITCIESGIGCGHDRHTYELRSSALPDRHGRPGGQVITLRNITDRTLTATFLLQQQQALAVMHDRDRLARELHDGLAQDLAGLRLRLSVWHKLIETDPARLHAELDTVRELLSQDIREVRRTIYALRPLALDELGFFSALRQFVNDFESQMQLHIDLSVAGPPERLPVLLELVIFRIIQEALNNTAKHAQAREVRIDLDLQAHDHLTLTICDDGCGFEPASLAAAAAYGHLGLVQMRDRVRDLSGQFILTSQPGRGTEITVTLPSGDGQNN